jgi:hypothetical protein
MEVEDGLLSHLYYTGALPGRAQGLNGAYPDR